MIPKHLFQSHNKCDYADGLYFCEGRVHSGAGVLTVLQSAKLALAELMKDDK